MLDIRFRRLVVVVGNSGIDAGVLTTLMPFGHQENGSMKSQYSVDDCEVIRSLGKKNAKSSIPNKCQSKASLRDRSLFIAWEGRGERVEDLGLNKVKFSRSPLWILLHWITFDDFRDSPPPPHSRPNHVFIFQENLSGPLSESFQSFRWSPVCSPKNQVIPLPRGDK